MKKLILKVLMCMLPMCMSCQSKQTFKSVNVDEFEKVMADTSYVLLDVRTATEYAEGHIPGTHFNIDVLQESFENEALKVLGKGKKVALYCRSGNRSKNAARILSEKGFQVVELSTGFKGWKAAGKPSEVTE
ncbi:MAG: rhodanese-like domain-containing protein [Bacteroidaceae bacterium]|nr:rhodanese-like domain-containing protein [Bacteroidaceae bacterium]